MMKTPEELQQEHATEHCPRTKVVADCPLCQEWRHHHKCHGLGSSDVVVPDKEADE